MTFKEIVNSSFMNSRPDVHYLLAMSGGVDSTVLFHLMKELNISFDVAHANFGLRGTESKEDEIFIEQLCQEHNITFHLKRFDTLNYIENHNESIQSAARKLRYRWFYDLLEKHSYNKVVTAHTLNDSAETFIINLARGTGLHGLAGIQNTDKILRPFIRITKNEIKSYAAENKIIWREDSSNAKDDYVRNRIRHHVIPALEDIEPNFLQQFELTTDFIQNDIKIIEGYVKQLKENIFNKRNSTIEISIPALKELNNTNLIYYLFEPYGFRHPQEILKLLNGHESAEIISEEYRLIKNREVLLLTPRNNSNQKRYLLHNLNEIKSPIHLRFHVLNKTPTSKIHLLDYEKIKFPLSLRIRQIGDVFYPLGMDGKSKKLSKFYKDIKLSKLEKEQTWLLCDADDKIIWVVGHRYDERFKATNKTKKWLQIEKLD